VTWSELDGEGLAKAVNRVALPETGCRRQKKKKS